MKLRELFEDIPHIPARLNSPKQRADMNAFAQRLAKFLTAEKPNVDAGGMLQVLAIMAAESILAQPTRETSSGAVEVFLMALKTHLDGRPIL